MELISLIEEDISALKSHKLISLNSDLEKLYKKHRKAYLENGVMPGVLYENKEYSIHKLRMPISRPYRMPSKGVRVWIYFNKETEQYFQARLYLAIDEDRTGFKSNDSFRIVAARIKAYSEA